MPALSVKLRVLLAAGSIGPFAAHGVRLELRPYFERERRERGELGGEDQRRVLDGGARVLGPGRELGASTPMATRAQMIESGRITLPLSAMTPAPMIVAP